MTDTSELHTGTTAERLAARGPLAVAGRQAVLEALANESFDLVIVGGGITGAGVAREAALAGFRTALVERDDFASGTSSRSSRLIHGGVRYLEHGHLGLVFESSRERRLLLHLAPHLVRPLSFTWPVYRGARVPRWKLRAGLMLYDALALFQNVGRHHSLTSGGVSAAEPALSRDGLVGGARYWDAATDDSRITLANAIAARDAGAFVANHVGVVGGVPGGVADRGKLVGVLVQDQLSGEQFTVRASVIVNATGPWSDATSALTGAAVGSAVLGSAGTHIAVPRQRLGNRDAITLVSPVDGRVMFVLPAGVHAIVGTTERPARVDPDNIRATEPDISYLLHRVNQVFPYAQLSHDDVITAWAGIRPLAAGHAGAGGANSASREHAIQHRADGLVSVTGGKLTTYRSMAHDVLEHAAQELRDSAPTGGESRYARVWQKKPICARAKNRVAPNCCRAAILSRDTAPCMTRMRPPMTQRLLNACRWPTAAGGAMCGVMRSAITRSRGDWCTICRTVWQKWRMRSSENSRARWPTCWCGARTLLSKPVTTAAAPRNA